MQNSTIRKRSWFWEQTIVFEASILNTSTAWGIYLLLTQHVNYWSWYIYSNTALYSNSRILYIHLLRMHVRVDCHWCPHEKKWLITATRNFDCNQRKRTVKNSKHSKMKLPILATSRGHPTTRKTWCGSAAWAFWWFQRFCPARCRAARACVRRRYRSERGIETAGLQGTPRPPRPAAGVEGKV